MRYIDSGTRHPDQALATWLVSELESEVAELRIQSGFFSRDALRPLMPRFAAMVEAGTLLKVVIGSNDGQTLASHSTELAQALGLPRGKSALAVVYLAGAFYHPKTIHMRRSDGTQAAYVGSANFTRSGIAAKHIEAGVTLDSAHDDNAEVLDAIAAATDAWFTEDRPGVEIISEPEDVEKLLEEGVLSAAPMIRPPRPKGAGGKTPKRPSQTFLVQLAQPQTTGGAFGDDTEKDDEQEIDAELAIAQHTPPYPPYMYFAPDAEGPTFGAEALSGFGLGDAEGLIVNLSRDNDRHWREAPGTANLSVPVAVASSMRFGFYGDRDRPRAEFDLFLRYIDDDEQHQSEPARTGLMSYGYTDGDTGHADLRLVLPKPPVAPIREALLASEKVLPRANDLAILQWPTASNPTFRMTVTNPDSELGQTITNVWNKAAQDKQLVSRGSCWLPSGITPAW